MQRYQEAHDKNFKIRDEIKIEFSHQNRSPTTAKRRIRHSVAKNRNKKKTKKFKMTITRSIFLKSFNITYFRNRRNHVASINKDRIEI